MKLRINTASQVVSAIIGYILGYIGGPAFILIIWGVVGLVIGAYCVTRKAALINGAIYGFFVSYIFMLYGYSGSQPLSTRLLPFMVLGLFGAVCGATLGFFGYSLRTIR
jgi:hypothetical protein